MNLYQAGFCGTMNQIPSPPSPRLLVHLHRLRGGGRLWLPEEVAGRLQRRNRQGGGGATRWRWGFYGEKEVWMGDIAGEFIYVALIIRFYWGPDA